jgi:hypothetical protein
MSYNPFQRLVGLLPKRPLQVGNVLAVDGGVCTIELPGGGIETARGEATIGDRVFFRDGAVEGAAPTLPIELIEV